ncbi:ankyrin repeat domain-containing protein [Rickettsia amblyommatis]|uniref:Ankyrin repeat family protein n=1 Tax=Rickettsia amblyommatis str. Ac/Pa TaxID=1359164 RepID=A0A0F3N1N3_RICAM|nr:ankyrin repeat family protein [Rickettsia amblyommatis str. Ac/Pa]
MLITDFQKVVRFLHNAARIGNVNNVRLLLSQGADVNALDAKGKKL